jgi:hypothetical protein
LYSRNTWENRAAATICEQSESSTQSSEANGLPMTLHAEGKQETR